METVKIKQATKEGGVKCGVLGGDTDLSYPDSKTRRGRVQGRGNVCPTLTAQNQDICKIGQISSDKSQYGTVISDDKLGSQLFKQERMVMQIIALLHNTEFES